MISLHPQLEPQPFLQFQNTILMSSSGVGSNNVVIGFKVSFCSTQSFFWGYKLFPNQGWVLIIDTNDILSSCCICR